jgi:hypothetical protein
VVERENGEAISANQIRIIIEGDYRNVKTSAATSMLYDAQILE